MFRIGVDVGGTNTDSALLDVTNLGGSSRGVLATCKTATTPKVTDGIKTAIQDVLEASGVERSRILNVAIGTTHFVNAVVETDARRLSKVAVLRICGPYTRSIPPFSDFPYALREVVEGPHYYLNGGLEIDGREIDKLDTDQVKSIAKELSFKGIKSVALVGVFSALDSNGLHEERCKALLHEFAPGLSVVCSHTIGGPGLLERENATVLNAAILAFAKKTIAGFRRAMRQLDLTCPLYVTQNDGTLADAASAAELPVKTFASGPTNSLMGAAYLQGFGQGSSSVSDKQVIVVDIGGTTTDVCALLPSGFPRQAPNFVEVGGVRTAFSMPEVLSIALGGGSRVRTVQDRLLVGPDSVAHRLRQDALVFGGDVLTTTDIIVASGAASVGDPSRVRKVTSEQIAGTKKEIKRLIETAIDTMKVSSDPVVVLLVGGGSILVTEDLDGVEQSLCPPHHDSANAVGAAIAKVSGDVDIIEVLAGRDENEAVAAVKERAIVQAIANGADPQTVSIATIEKLPLQYVTNKATRLICKAVGDLKIPEAHDTLHAQPNNEVQLDQDVDEAESSKPEVVQRLVGSLARPTLGVNLKDYRPQVKDKTWYLSPVDVELIASGCGVLGTGGGGSSYNMALDVLGILQRQGTGRLRVISPDALADDAIVVEGAGYGAPSVSNERLSSGTEVFDAVDTVNRIMGYKDFTAIVAVEIGGGNGLVTFPTSVHYDRPVVDCDLMGRGKRVLSSLIRANEACSVSDDRAYNPISLR
jgi:N-methylhydantoinase A/oxoprolinase/acetone carboxylase beta subunit